MDANHQNDPKNTHFGDQSALEHVLEKKENFRNISEAHGVEIPGHISAGADAARETAVGLMLIWSILFSLGIAKPQLGLVLSGFGAAWIVWKVGRSAWLGWSRLERMHRLVEEERWEIEHHRPSEREELIVLYGAKGFEGKLLEEVVDVLMADEDRLLRVMLEEEMGLTLEAFEHPLKQCFGALFGALTSFILCFGFYFAFPSWGMILGAGLTVALSAFLAARFERNEKLKAVVWNIALVVLTYGVLHFFLTMAGEFAG